MSHSKNFRAPVTAGVLLLLFALSPAQAVESTLTIEDGIRVISDDGREEFRFGGRIHIDWVQTNDDVTNFNDTVKIRRLRPYVRFRRGDWTFQASGDVGSIVNGIKELWLQKEFGPRLSVRVGNLVPPFGMNSTSSSNYIPFVDRSLIHMFVASYGLGAEVTYVGDNWTVAASFVDQPLDPDTNERERHGQGFVGRVTFDPYRSGPNLLHFGASIETRSLPINARFRLRSKPETHSVDDRLIDTRTIADVNHIRNYGLEAALRIDSFSMQGEFLTSRVQRKNLQNLTFDGYYMQASYILTGERRLYRASSGTFTGVEPSRKLGAVELAVRYSQADLTNEDIIGGHEQNWTFALNWYLSRKTRFMLNYINVDANLNRDGVRDQPKIFVLRYQTFF